MEQRDPSDRHVTRRPAEQRSSGEIRVEGPPYGSEASPSAPLAGTPAGELALLASAPEILSRLDEGVYLAAGSGRILEANPAFLRLLGAEHLAELAGRSIGEFVVEGTDDRGLIPEGRIALRCLDGSERSVDHRLATVRPGGQGDVAVGIVHEASMVLDEGRLHAQRLSNLGALAARVAHDINNMLNAVMGYADLLAQEGVRGSARGKLERLRHAAVRGAELTNQLLIYAGRGATQLARVDLSRLVEETTRLFEISIAPQTTLRYELARDLPLIIGEPVRLRQAVMNLILNASDAIGESGGTVTVRTGVTEAAPQPPSLLSEQLHPRGPYVTLEVTDTGGGMDPATQRKAFEPYFTSKKRGQGLGLASVLEIVRVHRGGIEIDSRPGGGTTLRVLLPTADASAGG